MLWLGYILLLGPVWGNQLTDINSLIEDRADYLKSIGGKPHPILEIYAELSLYDRWKCGSLLGALFFSLPLALVSSFIESAVRVSASRQWRWIIRLSLTIPWIYFHGGLIHHFSSSVWLGAYGWITLLGLPMFFGDIFENFLNRWKEHYPKGTRWKTLLVPSLILLPILIHPVWSLFLSPRNYPELDKRFGTGTSDSIRLTTARDWFLLNKDGRHWFNSWYYGSAPLLMERDRVTQFQPMVVALIGIDKKKWFPWLGAHFSADPSQRGQPIYFFEPESASDLDGPLFRDEVDYVALDSTMADKGFTDSWPSGSFGFFSNQSWEKADGVTYHDLKTFLSKEEKRPGGSFYRTPLIERKEEIWSKGMNTEQTLVTKRFKKLFFEVQSRPLWMGALATFGGVGFLVFFAWALSPVAKSRPSMLPVIGVLCTFLQFENWGDALRFQLEKEGEGFWNEYEVLKESSFALRAADVQDVLKQPRAEDARIRILQWLIMGRAYPYMNKDIKKKIEAKIAPEIETYSSLSFNLRYKLLDACSGIIPLHSDLKKEVAKERHPYVRWYARDKGFDPN